MPNDLQLKSVRIYELMSEETVCFSASLYLDGVLVGSARNHGHGAANEYDIKPKFRKAWDEFEKFCEAQPPCESEYSSGGIPMDVDLFIGLMLEQWQERQGLIKLCRKGIVFRLKSHTYKKGEWEVISLKYTLDNVKKLELVHGNDLAEIANEQFVDLNSGSSRKDRVSAI